MYATELFIRATAILLQKVIIVTKANSTCDYPYEVFWPCLSSSADNDLHSYGGPFIMLGHASQHFQALFFNTNAPWQQNFPWVICTCFEEGR